MTGIDAQLMRDDPDRRLAALFAAPDLRARLFSLYAFYHEIAKIPDAVSEPMIGEMRLAWARDAVDDLFAHPRKVRRHDVYEGLAALCDAPGSPDRATLARLVEARSADLGAGPFSSATDRLDYVDRTAGILMQAAARLSVPELDLQAAQPALEAAGRLWGLTGLLRAFPALAAAGRPPLTEAEMATAGLSETDLTRGRKPDAVKVALGALQAEAHAAGAALARTAKALPAEAFPAVGYASLARGYLGALDRVTDPYRTQVDRPLMARQARLVWGSLTGRL